MKRPLYCKCGGLIKAKSKETYIPRNRFDIFVKYHYDNTKSVNYYVCSKCGKKYN